MKNALKTPYESQPSPDNPNPRRCSWTEDNEKSFVAELESELDKVFTFQRVKAGEVIRRIKSSEREVNDVITRLDGNDGGGPAANGDRGANKESPSEEDFMLLEEDLSDIIADVHDLAKFTQLNYTGFQKIIKKHDVRDTKGNRF